MSDEKTAECCYCHVTYPIRVLRPFGPDKAMACFDCGMSPENFATTDRYVVEHIATMLAAETDKDHMVVSTPLGVMPMKKGQA